MDKLKILEGVRLKLRGIGEQTWKIMKMVIVVIRGLFNDKKCQNQFYIMLEQC